MWDYRHKNPRRVSWAGLEVVFLFAALYILFSCTLCLAQSRKFSSGKNWDRLSRWETETDGKSTINVESVSTDNQQGLKLKYNLSGNSGWVLISTDIPAFNIEKVPLIFRIKFIGRGNLEIKFIDSDGSVFGRKINLKNMYAEWTDIVIYGENVEYWWGGDEEFNKLAKISFALSGGGSGTVWLDEIMAGKPGMPASFGSLGPQLDPDRELAGYGFKARRDKELIPEDALVLEWLKQIQDTSSKGQNLLPSMETTQIHTFNNSLAAIAFILKGEKERAERILDFFAEATDRENDSITLQNFFYKGEARGFFQHVTLNLENDLEVYRNTGNSDRWMGDILWLLMAYKYYEITYNSDKYKEITGELKDLLISWYKNEGKGGYVQHGWRNGDAKLHENHGHPEGNIGCYAVFKLCGEDKYARKIKIWLNGILKGKRLPLDLYTWRVLAYGSKSVKLLNIPEYDLRYRKTLRAKGKPVAGFYHGPDIEARNIWLDGTGHIACAYITLGDKERGYFYSNQLDAFIIEREINGIKTHALPYTANNTGGYEWVRLDRGFVSVAAWYIFAKNGFNPLRLIQVSLEE